MSLPLGDVARDLRGADDPAVGIPERRDGRGNVDALSVGADPDGLEVIDTLAAPDAREDSRFLPLPLRREDHQHRPTDRLLRGVSKESLRPGIPRGDDAPEGLADDGVVRGVDDSLEQLLALAKRRFGALALRDVAHECAKADTIPGSDRCDRQLHGEFVLVTPEGGDLDPAIEQGTLAGGEIALESLRVLGAVALGNDGLREQPPERLARAPAEQGFGLAAPAGDGPGVIDGDERIERRIEDQAYALLARAQPFPRTAPLGIHSSQLRRLPAYIITARAGPWLFARMSLRASLNGLDAAPTRLRHRSRLW